MKALFLNVLEISLSTSVIVLLLLLSSRFLSRRYAAKWKYAIWTVLALRLVLPFQLRLPQRQILLDVPAQLASPVSSSVTAMSVAPNFTKTPAAQALSPLDILGLLWLAGAGVFLAVHLVSYFRYRRHVLKQGRRVTDAAVLQQIRSITQELSIRTQLPVLLDENAGSPMIIGFFRPILVMPDMAYQPMELYFVLKHELIHLKRHDMLAKLLFVTANAVHWFNPLMYLMQKQAVVDMELSCDERVVQGSVYETRKAYTETLLSTLSRSYKKPTGLSTQFYGGKQVMKQRFRNILTRVRKKSGLTILLLVLAAVVILGAVIGVSVGERETEEAQQMLEVANDFCEAYASGDREAMRQYMADTYQGDLPIQLVTDLWIDGRVHMTSNMQPGDLSVFTDDIPNIRSTDAPVGSTFTAIARRGFAHQAIDAMNISFIKQENGWKIRSYELVNWKQFSETAYADPNAVTEPVGDPGDLPAVPDGDPLDIMLVAELFTYTLLSGDPQQAADYMANPNDSVGPVTDVGFQRIGAVRGIPTEIGEPMALGTTLSVTVEFYAAEYDGDPAYLGLNMVKKEEGWKILAYTLDTGDDGTDSGVQETVVGWYDETDDAGSPETSILTGNALAYTAAFFENDTETMESLRADGYVPIIRPYTSLVLSKSQVMNADVKFAPQSGDISIFEEDEVSVYSERVPVGSTMTVLLEVQDTQMRIFVSMRREADGWKVYDWILYQDDAQQINELAVNFTNALYNGDKDFANSCMSVISSQRVDETLEDIRFLGIHEVKGVPYFHPSAEDGTRASVSVEHRQGEYAEDTYTYLMLELIKEQGQWKVYSYIGEG